MPNDDVPGADQAVLGHVVLFVREMARAPRAFERLGFRLATNGTSASEMAANRRT